MSPSDDDIVVDGYTWAEIKAMFYDGVAQARCALCQEEQQVEPDARNYDCHSCGGKQSVSSPLVKIGLM